MKSKQRNNRRLHHTISLGVFGLIVAYPFGTNATLLAQRRNPNTSSTPAPAVLSEEEIRNQRAVELYSAGNYGEAAQELENLWQDTQEPKYLFNAGVAHEAAGNDSRAIYQWRLYQSLDGLSQEQQNLVRERITNAKVRTCEVRIVLMPSEAVSEDAKIYVRSQGDKADFSLLDLNHKIFRSPTSASVFLVDLEPGTWSLELANLKGFPDTTQMLEINAEEVHGSTKSVTVRLTQQVEVVQVNILPKRVRTAKDARVIFTDPQGIHPSRTQTLSGEPVTEPLPAGSWKVRVEAPGYHPFEEIVQVNSGTASVDVDLEKDRTEPLYRARIGLATGFAVPGAAMLGAGIGLSLVNGRAFRQELEGDFPAVLTSDDSPFGSHTGSMDRQLAFTALAGAGGGLLVGSIIGGAVPNSRKAWIAQMSAGGVFSVAGTIYSVIAWNQIRDWGEPQDGSPPETKEGIRAEQNQRVAAAGILGFGAGVLVSGVTGFLVQHIYLRSPSSRRRAALSPHIHINGQSGGISLQGNF